MRFEKNKIENKTFSSDQTRKWISPFYQEKNLNKNIPFNLEEREYEQISLQMFYPQILLIFLTWSPKLEAKKKKRWVLWSNFNGHTTNSSEFDCLRHLMSSGLKFHRNSEPYILGLHSGYILVICIYIYTVKLPYNGPSLRRNSLCDGKY